MLTFKQYIAESMDTSYPYKKDKKITDDYASTHHRYTFKDRNKKIHHVRISHEKDESGKETGSAGIAFTDSDRSVEETGKQGRHAIKIFSTVKKIADDHANKHKNITNFKFVGFKSFDPKKKSESRTNLYDRIVNKLGGTIKKREMGHSYSVPVKRES